MTSTKIGLPPVYTPDQDVQRTSKWIAKKTDDYQGFTGQLPYSTLPRMRTMPSAPDGTLGRINPEYTRGGPCYDENEACSWKLVQQSSIESTPFYQRYWPVTPPDLFIPDLAFDPVYTAIPTRTCRLGNYAKIPK